MLIIGSVQTRQDIEKRFSASFKGIKNGAFPVKNLAFKIFIFILCKIHHFCQNFKKSCFILFIDVWPVCCQWYIVIVSFFDKVIRINVEVPSIRIALSIGSFNCKNCLSEGHPRFLSIFPFVNLRIKSIV